MPTLVERATLPHVSPRDTKIINRSVVVKSFADAKEFGVYALGYALTPHVNPPSYKTSDRRQTKLVAAPPQSQAIWIAAT